LSITFTAIPGCPETQPFAECCGVDLSKELDAAQIEVIKAGLLQHGLLLFRNQLNISPQREVSFNQAFNWHDANQTEFIFGFGAPTSEHKVSGAAQIPEWPQVSVLGNVLLENYHGISNTQLVQTLGLRYSGWHADGLHDMFDGMPELTTMYNPAGRQTIAGGHTLFTSAVTAVDNMGEALAKELSQCVAAYVRCPNDDAPDESRRVLPGRTYMDSEGKRRIGFVIDSSDPDSAMHDFKLKAEHADGGGLHRCIRKHPLTGQDSLYVTPGLVVYLLDVETGEMRHDVEESADLLARALQPAVAASARFEHAWQEGDFIAWINTLVLHSASDASGIEGERLIHRVRLSTPKNRWSNGHYSSY
jgi:alpha-ketoglutarate-dependent taurine dioxygenase